MLKMIKAACLFFIIATLSACVFKFGDIDSIKKGNELAIDCKPDEALKALDAAEQSEGLAVILADYEREAILRETGRIEDAEAVKAARDSRTDLDEKTKVDAEASILETVQNIRKEREKRTGSPKCK